MIRHVARIVVVAGLFLFSWDGAKAQTLGSLTQQCEKLESFWRQNPSRQPNMVNIPNDADAAICYGYMSAFNGLRSLVVTPADGNKPDCSRGFGPTCRHTLGICVPGEATFTQGLAVFLAYARSHAPQWHEAAWQHYLTAMSQAFPCKGEYPEAPK
jgi:hypothetical protein